MTVETITTDRIWLLRAPSWRFDRRTNLSLMFSSKTLTLYCIVKVGLHAQLSLSRSILPLPPQNLCPKTPGYNPSSPRYAEKLRISVSSKFGMSSFLIRCWLLFLTILAMTASQEGFPLIVREICVMHLLSDFEFRSASSAAISRKEVCYIFFSLDGYV